MFVVTVQFTLKDGAAEAFLPLMRANATQSLESEPGCLQFDVCTDPDNAACVFLYEVYKDRAAFDAHLGSEHFLSFDAAVGEMIAHKIVQSYHRDTP